MYINNSLSQQHLRLFGASAAGGQVAAGKMNWAIQNKQAETDRAKDVAALDVEPVKDPFRLAITSAGTAKTAEAPTAEPVAAKATVAPSRPQARDTADDQFVEWLRITLAYGRAANYNTSPTAPAADAGSGSDAGVGTGSGATVPVAGSGDSTGTQSSGSGGTTPAGGSATPAGGSSGTSGSGASGSSDGSNTGTSGSNTGSNTGTSGSGTTSGSSNGGGGLLGGLLGGLFGRG